MNLFLVRTQKVLSEPRQIMQFYGGKLILLNFSPQNFSHIKLWYISDDGFIFTYDKL